MFGRVGIFVLCGVVTAVGCGPSRAQMPEGSKEKARVTKIEVIPGERIGAIALGLKRSALPAGALIQGGVSGEHRGIHFMLERDEVAQVWIPDLRKFEEPLHFKGKVVPKDASIESLKLTFGPCTKVEGVIGGTRYRCESGVQLGLDFKETGDFVQIRIRAA